MLPAVEGVHDEADGHPPEEPDDRVSVRRVHQEPRRDGAADRYDVGAAGHPKRPRQIRPAQAKEHHADTHEDEREQRSDARELPQYVDGEHAAGDGARDAGDDGGHVGRAKARVHTRRHGREEPIMRHRIEDARLPEEQHEHDRREAGDGTDLHRRRQPLPPGRLGADGDGMRDVQEVVVDDAGEHERDRDIEHRANAERTEDAEREIALRVVRLLRRGTDRVEADVREEDLGRALQHS